MSNLAHITTKIKPILRSHQVKKAAIFGSVARATNNINSDIDMLVELPENKSLLDLVRLENELAKALKKPVDLLTFNSINRLILNEVNKDKVVIYP